MPADLATATSTDHADVSRRRQYPTTSPPRSVRRLVHPPLAPLARYVSALGASRELVVIAGSHGSTIVVDRDAVSHRDRRLLAHLAADEPLANAMRVCELYLADPDGPARSCVRVRASDLEADPLPVLDHHDHDAELRDAGGFRYRLRALTTSARIRSELRWTREPPLGCAGPVELVSLRRVVGALENYEPACAMSAFAVDGHGVGRTGSVATLRAELSRLRWSRVVLNRRLRETVLRAVACDGLSMSQIAIRCGRTKRDQRGKVSGETSWLARRLGLLPEGGTQECTPWVHSDVLALIARRGLDVSPREVEL